MSLDGCSEQILLVADATAGCVDDPHGDLAAACGGDIPCGGDACRNMVHISQSFGCDEDLSQYDGVSGLVREHCPLTCGDCTCSVNQFLDTSGAAQACTACPAEAPTAPAGTTDVAGCLCAADTYASLESAAETGYLSDLCGSSGTPCPATYPCGGGSSVGASCCHPPDPTTKCGNDAAEVQTTCTLTADLDAMSSPLIFSWISGDSSLGLPAASASNMVPSCAQDSYSDHKGRMFSITVPSGSTLGITLQSSGTFNSVRELRFDGDCPGTSGVVCGLYDQLNGGAGSTAGDFEELLWENGHSEPQTAYYMLDTYTGYGAYDGNVTLSWRVVPPELTCPACPAGATSPAGSTNASQCIDSGTGGDGNGAGCVDDPHGAFAGLTSSTCSEHAYTGMDCDTDLTQHGVPGLLREHCPLTCGDCGGTATNSTGHGNPPGTGGGGGCSPSPENPTVEDFNHPSLCKFAMPALCSCPHPTPTSESCWLQFRGDE